MLKRLALVVVVVGVLAFGVGHSVGYHRGYTEQQPRIADLEKRLQPFEAKQRAATRIKEELVVSAHTIARYTFAPAIVPGTLSGSWRASGRGMGGVDDSINAFRFTDPSDAVLASSPRDDSGTFLVRVTAPGTYTFFFDNGGLLRATPRRVFLNAEFKPE